MRVYYHWGDLGDIIYSLPTVRAIGKGRMLLALPQARYDAIAPLLAVQPLIEGVERDPIGVMRNWSYIPECVTHDLNRYRMYEYGSLTWPTLVDAQAWPYAVTPSTEPWLDVDCERGKYDRAVVARSPRYHAYDADWDAEIERLRSKFAKVVFVGLEDEHRDFGRGLERVPCANALDLATLIAESRYFSGNQSFPLSIAIGLGVPHSVEVYPPAPNCSFAGMDRQRVF